MGTKGANGEPSATATLHLTVDKLERNELIEQVLATASVDSLSLPRIWLYPRTCVKTMPTGKEFSGMLMVALVLMACKVLFSFFGQRR